VKVKGCRVKIFNSSFSLFLMIKDSIFRAYDIRGIYPSDINEEVAKVIGRSYGTFIGGEGRKVAVGRDVRLSSPSLSSSLIAGIVETGVDVIDLGLVPTPVVYFAIVHWNLNGGVIVSASHNPPEWNGFKICKEKAKLVGLGFGLEKIMEIAKSGAFKLTSNKGRTFNKRDEILSEYKKFLLSKIKVNEKLKVGVDPGNGSCSCLAKEILEEFGLEVEAINDFPDGRFPSRSPEPTQDSVSLLRKTVVERKLDFGVAFDGDCDRALFVDDEGKVISGDVMLTLFVKHFLKKGEKVVFEVSCSRMLEEEIKRKGGIPVVTRVGHSFILEKMIEEKAKLGGEISSHLYFGDIYGIDDAIFATLKLSELLSLTKSSLSELLSELPKYEIYRENFEVSDELKFKVIEKLQEKFQGYKVITLDGVKVILEDGWFILRASNTLPQVKLSAEAKNKEKLKEIVDFAKANFFATLKEISSKSKV